MKINIVLVDPPNLGHGKVFEELIILLFESIKDLGYEVIRTVNVFKQDYLNIIIAGQNLPYNPGFIKLKYIMVQLEQLGSEGGWLRYEGTMAKFISNSKPLLENACQIWDYSQENINFLKTLNLEAKLIPLGFHPNLQTIKHASKKDIDVFFYGSLSQRRIDIVEELKKHCNCVNVFGVYGTERDNLIGRSKIILNLHHNESKILQQVRLFYPMINKCFVLSEECSWNPYDDSLITSPYDQLIAQTLYWLKHDQEREIMANKGFEKIKTINTREMIKTALAEL